MCMKNHQLVYCLFDLLEKLPGNLHLLRAPQASQTQSAAREASDFASSNLHVHPMTQTVCVIDHTCIVQVALIEKYPCQ